MNIEKRTKYQISIGKLNTNHYRKKDVSKLNNNEMNKNRETDK